MSATREATRSIDRQALDVLPLELLTPLVAINATSFCLGFHMASLDSRNFRFFCEWMQGRFVGMGIDSKCGGAKRDMDFRSRLPLGVIKEVEAGALRSLWRGFRLSMTPEAPGVFA